MNLFQRCLFAVAVGTFILTTPPCPLARAESLSEMKGMPEPTLPKPAPKTNGPKLPAGIVLHADLKYGEHGNGNLLDIYLPEKFEGSLPLIVYVHGGGWANGDKTATPVLFQFLAKGFAVASINYRLSGEAPFPAQIHDCKGAIRWLRAHAAEYHIDPDRIGVWGVSAGGHLVALLGTSGAVKEIEGNVGGNLNVSSQVQGVSDYAGPTDMLQYWDQAGDDNVFKAHRGNTYFDNLFGKGPLEDHKDLVRQANPIIYIKAGCPPFQIIHGDKDTLVPLGQAQLLVDALKAKGYEPDYTIVKGAGHGFGQLQYRATIAFFEKLFMKPTAPATH